MSTPGVYHDEKFILKIYGRYPDLIGKYQRSVKDMMPVFFYTDFVAWIVTWIVTFYQLMLVVTGVMHEADNAYSIRSTWLCYQQVRFLITAYIC